MHFPRTELAHGLVRALNGSDPFSNASSGLFLAAPRRTGKSTFLQQDLQPALETTSTITVYVDLWADRNRDPALLIRGQLARALEPHRPIVHRALRAVANKIGVKGVDAGGIVQLDLDALATPEGATLADALLALHLASGKPVALIIDEAQHALVHESGDALMAGLKSARDQMNAPGKINLMLVMSGSDRDKLLRLTNTRTAAFYGSDITPLPLLGRDFIAHVAGLLRVQYPQLPAIDQNLLWGAFEIFGNRPQLFLAAIGQAVSRKLAGVGEFEPAVLAAAHEMQRAEEQQMRSDYLALNPLEQAVLEFLLSEDEKFRPYNREALEYYGSRLGKTVAAPQVQRALNSLRDRNPALVWKSSHGEYSVEDSGMIRWYQAMKTAGEWPPKP